MSNDDHLIIDPDKIEEAFKEIEATIKRLPAITPDLALCPNCPDAPALTTFGDIVYRCEQCRAVWTKEALGSAWERKAQ